MNIICEKCHKNFNTGVKSRSTVSIAGESRLNGPCPYCTHVNQISDVKIKFNYNGDVETVTPINNQASGLRFFDKEYHK
jgi:RNase P subunit RPR2